MKGTGILLFVALMTYSKPAAAQSKDSSYYKGNLPLIIKTIKKINRSFFSESDFAYSILAVIEINTKGKLENLQISTFKSSDLPDTVYDILLATKNEWVNNTNSNLYFELPIYIIHVYDDNREDSLPIITTLYHNENEMTSYIKLDPIVCRILQIMR